MVMVPRRFGRRSTVRAGHGPVSDPRPMRPFIGTTDFHGRSPQVPG